MKTILQNGCLVLVILLGVVLNAQAEMKSDSYRITSTVLSGGGAAIFDIYQMNSTIGQPTPLMDPNDPPISPTYNLLPGFHYTLAVGDSACFGDSEPDSDVDGADLAHFIVNGDLTRLDLLGQNYGKLCME